MRRSISGAASGGMSPRRAMLRRGFLLSGSMPASHGSGRAAAAEARLAVPRNARIGVAAAKRALDRRVDRAFDAAKRLVVGEPQDSRLTIVEIELLQSKRQQRQGVGAPACLDVGKQALSQARLDRELSTPSLTRRAGPSMTSP